MKIETFTGGIFDTNCFLIENGDQTVLIDAPQDSAAWLARENKSVSLLLLTHGHIDHVWDAAQIKRDHGCKVGYHRDGLQMLTEPDFFKKFGFGWEIAPVQADLLIEESESKILGGVDFQVLLVPGHCPGSLCFFSKKDRILFGGDVLFAGGVGRWDLPGGDMELLLSGIKNKILPLGEDVRVLPGHGPGTTIGRERQTNPYIQ
jgi:glyoxylase-like metal-dependent hydrolase (beta-lactamase superfamily II)